MDTEAPEGMDSGTKLAIGFVAAGALGVAAIFAYKSIKRAAVEECNTTWGLTYETQAGDTPDIIAKRWFATEREHWMSELRDVNLNVWLANPSGNDVGSVDAYYTLPPGTKIRIPLRWRLRTNEDFAARNKPEPSSSHPMALPID